MKKIVLAVMAIAAIGFTSCGNKAQQAEAVDSVAIVDSLAGAEAQGIIDQLKAQLEAGDAGMLQQVLTTAKEKIAQLVKENPQVAKEYVAKVQNFLSENAEKVKAVVGDNAAVATALSAVTEIDPESVVSGLIESVGDAATDAKDAAVDAATNAKDAAVEAATNAKDAAVDAAKQKVEEQKEAAKQKASEAVDNAAKDVKKGLGL